MIYGEGHEPKKTWFDRLFDDKSCMCVGKPDDSGCCLKRLVLELLQGFVVMIVIAMCFIIGFLIAYGLAYFIIFIVK